MEILGQRIKELRIEKNITQPQLAQKIGVSNGIVSQWENNKNEPKATFIKKLAIALKTSSDYLIGLTDELN